MLVPVTHPKHQYWLGEVIDLDLANDIVRWELGPDGVWHRQGPEAFDHGDAQARFYRWVSAKQRR